MFVAFFIAFPTIVAYLANAWALAYSGPTLVTVYIRAYPVRSHPVAFPRVCAIREKFDVIRLTPTAPVAILSGVRGTEPRGG